MSVTVHFLGSEFEPEEYPDGPAGETQVAHRYRVEGNGSLTIVKYTSGPEGRQYLEIARFGPAAWRKVEGTGVDA